MPQAQYRGARQRGAATARPLIARFRNDAAWPKPVWGAAPPRTYEREELQSFVTPLRRKIWLE